jgi:hypothetical protein
MTTTTTTTAEKLAEMLTENTGRHMLDSGGAYGRNWERNQGRTVADWEAEPEVSVDSFGLTVSTFHFLNQCLDYDAELDAEWQAFADLPENEDKSWLALMEEFAESKTDGGEGSDYATVNTYNHESALSQVLQFTMWDSEGGDWVYGDRVLLQIHGGCDVRGGYTRPVLFTHSDNWGFSILDDSRMSAQCEGVEPPGTHHLDGTPSERVYHSWSTDDAGYHWYGWNDEPEISNSYGSETDIQFVEIENGLGCPVCGAKVNFGL